MCGFVREDFPWKRKVSDVWVCCLRAHAITPKPVVQAIISKFEISSETIS
jgi:hypothetical protein